MVLTIVMMLMHLSSPLKNDFNRMFAIEANVIEAIENGPVILDVRLRYLGKHQIAIRINSTNPQEGIGFYQKGAWKERQGLWFEMRNERYRNKLFNPGDELRITLYPHHWFKRIPQGPVDAVLSWTLVVLDHNGKTNNVALLTKNVRVHVKHKTNVNITDFVTKLERFLQEEHVLESERLDVEKHVVDSILYAMHIELLPIALRMMKAKLGPDHTHGKMRPFLYEWSLNSGKVHGQLIEYMKCYGGNGDEYFFAKWKESGVILNDTEVISLLSSNSLWIRTATYQLYPDKCPDLYRDAILREFADIQRMLKKDD